MKHDYDVPMLHISMSEMVAFYNQISGRPAIKKFADRKTAEARLVAALQSTGSRIVEDGADKTHLLIKGLGNRHQHHDNTTGKTADQEGGYIATNEEGEVKVAKKATVKKEAKAPKAAAVKKEKQPMDEEFGVRSGTHWGQLLATLRRFQGKQVKVPTLITAVFGSPEPDKVAPDVMVAKGMKGLSAIIEDKKLPYRIEREKSGKDVSFGLFDNT